MLLFVLFATATPADAGDRLTRKELEAENAALTEKVAALEAENQRLQRVACDRQQVIRSVYDNHRLDGWIKANRGSLLGCLQVGTVELTGVRFTSRVIDSSGDRKEEFVYGPPAAQPAAACMVEIFRTSRWAADWNDTIALVYEPSPPQCSE